VHLTWLDNRPVEPALDSLQRDGDALQRVGESVEFRLEPSNAQEQTPVSVFSELVLQLHFHLPLFQLLNLFSQLVVEHVHPFLFSGVVLKLLYLIDEVAFHRFSFD